MARICAGPSIIVTTTPKPVPALRRVLALPGIVLTGGASWHNPHASDRFIEMVREVHRGTRFGRQELLGELLEDFEGALWPRPLLDRSRHRGPVRREDLARVVIGVDPPATAGGDACGIVACGIGAD